MFRRLVEWLNRRTGGAVEAESRNWHLVCPRCGWRRSYWDLGGVRYKAASVGKRTIGRCPGCGKLTALRTEWVDDPSG